MYNIKEFIYFFVRKSWKVVWKILKECCYALYVWGEGQSSRVVVDFKMNDFDKNNLKL